MVWNNPLTDLACYFPSRHVHVKMWRNRPKLQAIKLNQAGFLPAFYNFLTMYIIQSLKAKEKSQILFRFEMKNLCLIAYSVADRPLKNMEIWSWRGKEDRIWIALIKGLFFRKIAEIRALWLHGLPSIQSCFTRFIKPLSFISGVISRT